VVLKGDRNLAKIVLALCVPGGLSHLLDGRKTKRQQNSNDGNHYHQFNQGKPAALTVHGAILEKDGQTKGAITQARSVNVLKPYVSLVTETRFVNL